MGSTLTNLLYHVVFSTKHRATLITDTIQADLYAYLGGIIKGNRGYLLEVGGIADHVHLLTRFPPTIAVAEMMKIVKAKSSGWVNRERPAGTHFGWQDGYAAFSVSSSQIEVVRRYIRNQKVHHQEQSFMQELITLLNKQGVEYDERYVFV
jgi:REP element-mobilizing transposase RayT